MATKSTPSISFWIYFVSCLLLLGILFSQTFLKLTEIWQTDPNYSHGLLVFVFGIFLIWRYARKEPITQQGLVGQGAFLVVTGCLFHLGSIVINWPLADFPALVLILRGAAVAIGGRKWANGLWFPILFLFFMFQLPVIWTGTVALWLQDLVAKISGFILQLIMICQVRGNSIRIAGVVEPLHVAQECSGLRQIVAFVALGSLVGYWMKKPFLFGLCLVLASIPIAIIANVIRILLMAIGVRYFGSEWLSGWMHDVPYFVTLPVGLGLFLLVGWSLNKLWPKTPEESPSNGES